MMQAMTSEQLIFGGLVALVGIVSGATAAVVGFGIGSLLTPLLLTAVEPHVAVAVIAIPHALATALRFVRHRAAVDYGVLRRFGIPSAIGGLTGALVQRTFTSDGLLIVLGVLLVGTGLANIVRAFRAWKPPAAVAFMLGGLSGFFGGIAGNQGGLRAASLTAFGLAPRAFLATSTAVALAIDVARTPVYLVTAGDALRPHLLTIAIASAGCLVGTILGERVFLGLSPERYRTIVGVGVAIVGIWLVVQAW
jgi:uncharacterized protein